MARLLRHSESEQVKRGGHPLSPPGQGGQRGDVGRLHQNRQSGLAASKTGNPAGAGCFPVAIPAEAGPVASSSSAWSPSGSRCR